MRAMKILQQLVFRSLASIHAKRLAVVFWAVRVLLRGGRLSLTALGRSAAGRASPKHTIKRVDRLLGNSSLHDEIPTFFEAVAKVLIGGRLRPVVLVDWTAAGPGHAALVATVPVDGRSLPIYAEVHPEKKYNSPPVHKRFLRQLAEVLPPGCRPIVVTDAGFKREWFIDVFAHGWDFVGRIRGKVRALDPMNPKWIHVRTLFARATTKVKDLGRWFLPRAKSCCLRLVIVRKRSKPSRSEARGTSGERRAKRRAWEPWLLATSLDDVSAKKIVSIYAKRMQIEETFRDAKSHRFGWSFEDALSRSSKRLEVLLLLATLAMLSATLVGQAAESRKLHHRYQANTIRTRRVLSLFFLGNNLIRWGDDANIPREELRASLEEIRRKMLCLEPQVSSFFVGIL